MQGGWYIPPPRLSGRLSFLHESLFLGSLGGCLSGKIPSFSGSLGGCLSGRIPSSHTLGGCLSGRIPSFSHPTVKRVGREAGSNTQQ